MVRSCRQEGNLQDLKPQWSFFFFNMNVCFQSIHSIKPRFWVWLKAWRNQTNQKQIFLSGMRRVSYTIPSTSCKWNYLVQTEAQWSPSTPPAPPRTVHATRVPGRRWVFYPPPLTSEVFLHSVISLILCLLAGVSCVLQLRTRSEICPLPTQAEEHVLEWLLQNHVRQQHCGCQTQ